MIESVNEATAPTRLQAAAKLCCRHNASAEAATVTPKAATTCSHCLLLPSLVTIVPLLLLALEGGHNNLNTASLNGKVTSGHDTARLHTTPKAANSCNAFPSRSGSSPIRSLPMLRVIGASVYCASMINTYYLEMG